MQAVDVWIEYASTYSYLTVARIGGLARARGITLHWQPFLLAGVRDRIAMPSPFVPYPEKLAYMWRDLERRAAGYGLPYRRPSSYPVNSLLTARVALLAAKEGWCQAFTERVFALHWTEDRAIGTEDNVGTALRDVGQEPSDVVQRAQSSENKDALKAQGERALALGIFGSPSFTVGNELFWGDDRLEDAIDWAAVH